jgi:hypothetical protein
VIDARGQPDLSQEAVCGDADLELGMEDLEGDGAAGGVVREKDARGAAPADFPMHRVPVPEGVPDERQEVAADDGSRWRSHNL